jgi:NadR type nicotinamide-nucleotide adenylyltransferase
MLKSEQKKIVVIGPESTGKSTLSEALAASLNTLWVPEYAREYCMHLTREYTEEDLLAIAKCQVQLEDKYAGEAKDYLICDTDLYVLKVWSEHKYGRCHPWILEQIASRKYDLYLLTDIDIEWQDDPLREHADPEMRRYFHNVYKNIVAESGVPWVAISGSPQERLKKAIAAVV